jgi:hypothetical protein
MYEWKNEWVNEYYHYVVGPFVKLEYHANIKLYIYIYIYLFIYLYILPELALRHKPEGREFDSRCGH